VRRRARGRGPGRAPRGGAARLTGALVGHWLAEAEKCRREYRFLAAIGALREALRVEPAPDTRERLRRAVATQAALDLDLADGLHQMEERRFAEAIETFTKLLALKPDHAVAHGKLGTAYAVTGREDLAVRHWRAVAESDPDDSYGHSMLGWQAYLGGRAADAVEAYHKAAEIEPFNAKIRYHAGLALEKLGRLPEAAD